MHRAPITTSKQEVRLDFAAPWTRRVGHCRAGQAGTPRAIPAPRRAAPWLILDLRTWSHACWSQSQPRTHARLLPAARWVQVSAFGDDDHSDGGDAWVIDWDAKDPTWQQDTKVEWGGGAAAERIAVWGGNE